MGLRAAGYVRVSTGQQAESGLSLAAQQAALEAAAETRGWELETFTDAGVSAATMTGRLQLQAALASLAAGRHGALVTTKLDRLARSLGDLVELVDRSEREGWALVVLDLNVDTASPHGRLLVGILGAISEWERNMARERTREALGAARERGTRLGRPPTTPGEVVERIKASRAAGASYHAIAEMLNAEGVPTAQNGARWWASSVRAIASRGA